MNLALNDHNPRRTFRSESRLLLHMPVSRTQLWDRAFSVAAHPLWNNAPVSIRLATLTDPFMRQLKTNLFRKAILVFMIFFYIAYFIDRLNVCLF